jgi:hypothetical protein
VLAVTHRDAGASCHTPPTPTSEPRAQLRRGIRAVEPARDLTVKKTGQYIAGTLRPRNRARRPVNP